MGLSTCFDNLTARLRVLADAVNDLRLTAVEDRPAGAEQMVLETVAGSVEELAGWIFEALGEAGAARDALALRRDRDTALLRLAACHERVNRLGGGAWVGLVSYETYVELARLAREYGGEWPGWLAMLRLGLESCGPPLNAAQTALLEAWREAAHAATGTGAATGDHAAPSASPATGPRAPGDQPHRSVLVDVNSQWRCFP
ncbi:MAG TPA: hypothetical protein VFC00_06215 [Micromonosporaceae bacterium]|nr:hypothetical protein [Micromonosporaceae bacterium]